MSSTSSMSMVHGQEVETKCYYPSSIWNMLETRFCCQAKAKKPSAGDGLGLQTRRFALVPVILTGGSGLCLVKGNVKAQSLLQSRMKETAERISQCAHFWSKDVLSCAKTRLQDDIEQ